MAQNRLTEAVDRVRFDGIRYRDIGYRALQAQMIAIIYRIESRPGR